MLSSSRPWVGDFVFSFRDVMLIKAVLNGACEGDCRTEQGKKYSVSPPTRVTAARLIGPAARCELFWRDVQVHRARHTRPSCSATRSEKSWHLRIGCRITDRPVAQLPQTAYHALGTPYSYFGLGRTNNYVERLFVGASLHPPDHITSLEALIPNSQLIINPPAPLAPGSNGSEIKVGPTKWRSELYLHPGEWVPWVAAAVAGAVFVLGFVVLGLRAKEQVSARVALPSVALTDTARGREGEKKSVARHKLPGAVEPGISLCAGRRDPRSMHILYTTRTGRMLEAARLPGETQRHTGDSCPRGRHTGRGIPTTSV